MTTRAERAFEGQQALLVAHQEAVERDPGLFAHHLGHRRADRPPPAPRRLARAAARSSRPMALIRQVLLGQVTNAHIDGGFERIAGVGNPMKALVVEGRALQDRERGLARGFTRLRCA